jgi:hypothetical protein
MYCLNFALKAVKNSGVFDNMHRNIAQTGAPRPDISFEQHLAESDGLLGQWGAEQARQHLGNIGYAVGPLVLPPDFFKHATSATLAEEVSERAVQDCAPGELPATSRVNGTRHQAPESLEERVDAFMVTRPDDKGVKRTYSASIEGFRLQEIARAKMRSR